MKPLLLAIFLTGTGFQALAADNPAASLSTESSADPVLGLDLDVRTLPLYRQILMDPNRKGLIPNSTKSLARLDEALAADRKALAESKPERQTYLRTRLFDRLVQKALYWQSVVLGGRESSGDLASSQRVLQETHQEIFSMGPQILKDITAPKERAAVLLQLLLAQAQYDDKRVLAVKNLAKIRPQLTHPRHLELVDFLVSLEAVYDAQGDGRRRGIKQLETLANRLDRRFSSLASLAIARSLAGFSSGGRPVAAPSPEYASYLRYVSRLCQTLTTNERNAIFDFSLGIWTLQSGFDHQWDPVPFNVGCYEQARQFPAFLERLALASSKRKQTDRALALYQHVSTKLSNPTHKQQINFKMALLLREEYRQGRKREAYQEFLVNAQQTFRGTPHGVKVAQMHDEFMYQELNKGLGEKHTPGYLASTRPIYQKYMDNSAENPDSRSIRAKWAEVLAAHGLRQESISTWISLAQGSSGSVRSQYLTRALALQMQTMKWNMANTWANETITDQTSLGFLKHIILLIREQSAGAEQALHTLNIAVIDRQLGLHESARQQLREVLELLGERSLRTESYTVLLAYALENKDYADLEKLALLGRRADLDVTRPVQGFANRDELYRIALEKQADALLASAKPEPAIAKLIQLISELRPSERRNRARYLVARSYQDLQKFAETKEQLQAIERDGVRDDIYRQALLDKGALLMAQGELAASVQTYSNFLQTFPQDPRRREAQFVIVDGLMAQAKHEEARLELTRLLGSRDLEDAEVNSLSARLMRIHQATLNNQWIQDDIAMLERNLPDKPELRARLAGLAYRENQSGYAQVRESVQMRLRDQSSSLFVVSDLMSQIAFERARKDAEAGFSNVQKSLMGSQDGVFQKIQDNYNRVRSSYAEACEVPYASHCGPALYETLFQAQRYRGLLQDLSMEQPGPEATLARQELNTYFTQEMEALEKRLADAIQHGNTLPDWILKLSVGDENFWRYSASAAARQINYLTLPSEMAGKSSFSFTKGSAE
jgi:tetratricopeptide (TPR) repeat protein